MSPNQPARNEENQNRPEGLLSDDLKANVMPARKENPADLMTGE
jgi:hypothetical protein